MNEASEEVVRRYFMEVWELGNTGVLDELLSPDFVDHDAPPGFGTDREANGQLASFMLAR